MSNHDLSLVKLTVKNNNIKIRELKAIRDYFLSVASDLKKENSENSENELNIDKALHNVRIYILATEVWIHSIDSNNKLLQNKPWSDGKRQDYTRKANKLNNLGLVPEFLIAEYLNTNQVN